jgi:YjbE family integral membrane protein
VPPVNAYVAWVLPHLMSQLSALLSVVIIDIVLAGDNAIVVGMAASGLPIGRRRRAITLGIGAATVLRILFATITMRLLVIIGLRFAGGVLLLWVAWKMYRELCDTRGLAAAAANGGSASAPYPAVRPKQKTTTQALTQIVIADLSMSLDNVIAVAGVSSQPWILVVGLVLSVALMGVASTYIARLLERHYWISWVGLGIVTFVALRLIWQGSTQIVQQTAGINWLAL